MSRRILNALVVFACAMPGCAPAPSAPAPARDSAYRTSQRPGLPPVSSRRDAASVDQDQARFSGVTADDRRFAEFLRKNSGGMVRQASVNAKVGGQIRVELDNSVTPDDTLPLTKSLMAGARKDFPGQPLTLSMYDPSGAPILKAIYHPDHGVQYRIAHEGESATRRDDTAQSDDTANRNTAERDRPASAAPLTRGGSTQADRNFAEWAEEHGKTYLRYVQADLERHGRLWFGVTRETRPTDVPELTRSLLEGAMKEFPRRELMATVFDPEGEKIGRARMSADGRLSWEK
ncbi:hypothetical protein SAMN05444166_2975 [Singulisphaera sp. GP187]|uniref:hypothetical protein n=1 Tax=Singulisphaera sp. GP187 TaxID=1882752 RepID=UPI00092A0E29|nr:hypothetical protein [Singulisphaera sp. GP187]SIO20381.1 hypothetical protein SAMN05444166_2975 [Singulisphaera sp. GP187]